MCQHIFADILTRLMTKSLFKWHKNKRIDPFWIDPRQFFIL